MDRYLKDITKEGFVFDQDFTIGVNDFLNLFDIKPFNAYDIVNQIIGEDEEDLTKLTIEDLTYIYNKMISVDYEKFWNRIEYEFEEYMESQEGEDDTRFDMYHEKWGL